MEKRTLTIEEMIANGASWGEITARVKEMQRAQEEKRKAEAREKEAAIAKERAAAVARERLVTAFVDWGIAEGFIPETARDEFAAEITDTINTLVPEMRQAIVLKALFGQR